MKIILIILIILTTLILIGCNTNPDHYIFHVDNEQLNDTYIYCDYNGATTRQFFKEIYFECAIMELEDIQ